MSSIEKEVSDGLVTLVDEDTGVGGKPLKCVLYCVMSEETEMYSSEDLLDEFRKVLDYQHLPFSDKEKSEYPKIIRIISVVVEPEDDIQIARDNDDNKFLECAVESDADYLISGDIDILNLGCFRGTDIVKPAQFIEQRTK